MWRKPGRPNKEISQTFNSGVVTVYSVTDSAVPGYTPKTKLTPKVRLPYDERKLGIQRFYSGKQNQVQIQRVIRCPVAGNPSSQDVAITEDGQQYEIHLVQTVRDVYPPSLDLTLSRITQKYEVPL